MGKSYTISASGKKEDVKQALESQLGESATKEQIAALHSTIDASRGTHVSVSGNGSDDEEHGAGGLSVSLTAWTDPPIEQAAA